jgi:acyl carrier protein
MTMPDSANVRDYINTVLVLELECAPEHVTGDITLGATGLDLESLDVLHLIYCLSDEFGIKIIDDLDPYMSMTVDELAGEVLAVLADAPSRIAKI